MQAATKMSKALRAIAAVLLSLRGVGEACGQQQNA
jgi:hypothetical protein